MTAWFNLLTDEVLYQLSEYSDQDWVGIPCEIRLCDALLGLIVGCILSPFQAIFYTMTGVLLYLPLCVYGYIHVYERAEQYGLDRRGIRRRPVWVVLAAFLALVWPIVSCLLCMCLPVLGALLGFKSGFVVYWTKSPRWEGIGGTICNTGMTEETYDLDGDGQLDRDLEPTFATDGGAGADAAAATGSIRDSDRRTGCCGASIVTSDYRPPLPVGI